MPELPEAEVVVRQLRQRILGASIKDCWIGRPDIVRQGLQTVECYRGARITAIERHGKSVVLSCSRGDEPRFLVAELGMTGLLLFAPPARLQRHTHVILTLEGGREDALRYWNPRRFGRIHLLDQEGLEAFLARRFGYDPLRLSFEQFHALVKGRRGRLKALLMHQQRLAGIGNIYANEILFRASLHPHRLARGLRRDRIERLYRVMQEVLTSAIQDGGSSVRDFRAPDGTEGRYARQHLVYDKEGQPCPNACGKTIRRVVSERSSFYCPFCQR